MGWIGVDLDGTLAVYDGWKGPEHLGEPVPAMVDRVKAWLEAGKDVRIFTARVFLTNDDVDSQQSAALSYLYIARWCEDHLGQALPITCQKDHDMDELWDDRARRIEKNTGEEE